MLLCLRESEAPKDLAPSLGCMTVRASVSYALISFAYLFHQVKNSTPPHFSKGEMNTLRSSTPPSEWAPRSLYLLFSPQAVSDRVPERKALLTALLQTWLKISAV